MKRLEHLIQQSDDNRDRLAVMCAICLAQSMKEEFVQKYGTYGWEALQRLAEERPE